VNSARVCCAGCHRVFFFGSKFRAACDLAIPAVSEGTVSRSRRAISQATDHLTVSERRAISQATVRSRRGPCDLAGDRSHSPERGELGAEAERSGE